MVLGNLLLNIPVLLILLILVFVGDIYGQAGLCRKAPLRSIIQGDILLHNLFYYKCGVEWSKGVLDTSPNFHLYGESILG